MKYTKIMLAGFVTLSMMAFAMPTPEQTKKVEPLVVDLMRDDQAALKSGKKTRTEVAESAMRLADQADSEAAKLLLIKGAYNLYVKAGEFDKAVETLRSLQTAIPDIPPANLAGIIESSLRNVPRKNGGQLYRLLGETKTRMRYANELKALEKSVKEKPGDRTLRQKLAEHYAYLGDWDAALENFAATESRIGEIAKTERDGKGGTKKVADFWWDYPKSYAKGSSEEIEKCFHAHAAKLYEEAIASDDIKGLNKIQAERRIEEVKGCEVFVCPAKANDSKDSEPNVDESRVESGFSEGMKTYGGYTWSYRARNGEATLVAEKDGKYSCAVSPTPVGKVLIPRTLNNIKVTSIGTCTFLNCRELTAVMIPESVKVIGPDAFKGCCGLKTATIPGSVKKIERGAFYFCGGLTAVTIQEGVEVIDQGVFTCCTDLTSVTIPSSVTNIGAWATSDCSKLTSLTILGDVRQIGRQAFWNCPELTSVTIRGERPDAPNDIFQNCGKLKSIHVPANAKSWAGMKEWQGIPLVFDAK